MEQKIYHGNLTTKQIAQALMGEFNQGNFRAQAYGNDKNLIVQIGTKEWLQSGGQTALSVTLRQVEDGVSVQVGKQAWMGVAASLGQTLLSAMRNTWNVISRLDDLAQVIENTARSANATFELSERLRRLTCEYCGTANPVGTSNCIACGAPLGKVQPNTCKYCGFVLKANEKQCPNCGHLL